MRRQFKSCGSTPRETVRSIKPQLNTVSPEASRAYLRLLLLLDHPGRVDLLAQLLPQLAHRQQQRAISAMLDEGPVGGRSLTLILREAMMRTDRADVQENAELLAVSIADAFAANPSAAPHGELIPLIGQGTRSVRDALVRAVIAAPRAEIKATVLDALARTDKKLRKADLVETIRRLTRNKPDPLTAKTLISYWPDSASRNGFELKFRLIEAVRHLDSRGNVDFLLKASRDPHPVLRERALLAVTNGSADAVIPRLIEALDDPDPRVRMAAAIAIRPIDRQEEIASSLATRFTTERWPNVAGALADALGHHCSEPGEYALREALQRQPTSVSLPALSALARCLLPQFAAELVKISMNSHVALPLRKRAIRLVPADSSVEVQQHVIDQFLVWAEGSVSGNRARGVGTRCRGQAESVQPFGRRCDPDRWRSNRCSGCCPCGGDHRARRTLHGARTALFDRGKNEPRRRLSTQASSSAQPFAAAIADRTKACQVNRPTVRLRYSYTSVSRIPASPSISTSSPLAITSSPALSVTAALSGSARSKRSPSRREAS